MFQEGQIGSRGSTRYIADNCQVNSFHIKPGCSCTIEECRNSVPCPNPCLASMSPAERQASSIQ